MTDDRKQTGFTVDVDALEKAKERCEHGEFSDQLRNTVHKLAYGAKTTRREQVKDELAELRDERDNLRKIIREKEQEEQQLERKIERKEQELSDLQDTEAEYQGMLESMEANLRDGQRVWESTTLVETAADKTGKTPSEVLQDLKERNPEMPEEAFRKSQPGEPGKWRRTHNEYNTQHQRNQI